jgi:hypothetical protein
VNRQLINAQQVVSVSNLRTVVPDEPIKRNCHVVRRSKLDGPGDIASECPVAVRWVSFAEHQVKSTARAEVGLSVFHNVDGESAERGRRVGDRQIRLGGSAIEQLDSEVALIELNRRAGRRVYIKRAAR